MTEILSKKVSVPDTPEDIFEYLIDLNNFHELLPKDKISDWESSETQCSFRIQKAATIELIRDTLDKPHLITLKSGSKSPFPFTLDIHIEDKGDHSEGYLHFKGELNPFLKMMVEKPLTTLFNHIADRLVVVRTQN